MALYFLLLAYCFAQNSPVFEPEYTVDQIDSLRSLTRDARNLSVKELADLVPEQSGIYFCGCPKCGGGDHGARTMIWEFPSEDRVRCRYCGTVFPNSNYPENKEKEIISPSGKKQIYRWYADDKGHEYHFQGRALYERYVWCERMAYLFANLFALTGDQDCADRGILILGRFAQVFPDYPVRYNYPFQPVKFFPANQKYPYEGITEPYRGAKLNWWGYADIPEKMARAYDLLRPSGASERCAALLGNDIRVRIENDLLRLAYEFTNANPDVHTNMMPGTYKDMIIVGRVLEDPTIVHDTVNRFRNFVNSNFTVDGWWREITPSYHWQVVNSLLGVVRVAQGYSDPLGLGGEQFENLDLERETPLLKKALKAGNEAVLPNGRLIPINDTWAKDRRAPLGISRSRLWQGLGHAVLGAGSGDTQFQLHCNWSGAYGHSHADNASIILWALGKELLSDIGYTHTKYRNWTINTASHNTVVVDARSQQLGKGTDGNLRFYDTTQEHVQVIDVDASSSYSQCTTYRRRLIHVMPEEGKNYVVDLFEVKGGETHDYFLHGSADESGEIQTDSELSALDTTLVPEWGGQNEYEGENCLDLSGERFHSYWFLRNIRTADPDGVFKITWVYGNVGLRAHFVPTDDVVLYVFDSPSIRQAEEDNRRLEDFTRHGACIRRKGPASFFITVLEPFGDSPYISSVRPIEHGLEITYDGRSDRVFWDEEDRIVVQSADWEYDSGICQRSVLKSIIFNENGQNVFVTNTPLSQGSFVSLTIGETVMGFPVSGREGNHIFLTEDSGLAMDTSSHEVYQRYFPFRRFVGEPYLTIYNSTETR